MRTSSEFELFFKENYSPFYYYAYQLTDEEEVSRDIVMDGFEYVWKNFQNKDVDNWRAYTYAFIHHKCIDYIRHELIKEKYADLCLSTDEDKEMPKFSEDDERILSIRKAMRKLPPRTQLILKECYVNNKKYKEVAEELEISVNAVKQHLVKALKAIREEIKKEHSSQ